MQKKLIDFDAQLFSIHNDIKEKIKSLVFPINKLQDLFRVSILPVKNTLIEIKYWQYDFADNDIKETKTEKIIEYDLQKNLKGYYNILHNIPDLKPYFATTRQSTNINYYPASADIKKSFLMKQILNNIAKKSLINRMGYHVDDSKYTLVSQDSPGLEIKNNNEISTLGFIFFSSKLEHRIKLDNNERFSISTFLYEI